MKRDVDLMRKILIDLRENPNPRKIEIDGYDWALVMEHCRLLKDADMIRHVDLIWSSNGRIVEYEAGDITNKGYDFLELFNDDEFWRKVLQIADDYNVPRSFYFLDKIADRLVMK